MSTEINQALMQAISAVSSSRKSVYCKARGYSLDDWIEDQKFLAHCGTNVWFITGTADAETLYHHWKRTTTLDAIK